MTLLDRTYSRVVAEGAKMFSRVFRGPVRGAPDRTGITPEGLTDFQLREMMLDGSIYFPSTVTTAGGVKGGLRGVLKLLGRPCTAADESLYHVQGYFNPVPQIVGFYANALDGRFGDGLDPETTDGKELPDRVLTPLSTLWRWSNLDNEKQRLVTLAANLGTVGLRACYKPGDMPAADRVWLEFDDPSYIYDVEEDGRGNCQWVELRYTLWFKPRNGTDKDIPVGVREIVSRDEHSLQMQAGTPAESGDFKGVEQLTDAERANPLGVCPYTLLRHAPAKRGSFLGVHAYDGSEQAIHAINWTLSNTSASVSEHVWPTVFGSGSEELADEPITTGRYKIVWANSGSREMHPPDFKLLVAPLDFKGAAEHVEQCVGYLRSRQPQMILNDQRLMANLSGETLQQAMKAAEGESLRFRGRAEDSLVRILQIMLSQGVVYRLPGFDLGTGTGTSEAADRAYDDNQGPEAFRFKKRPALPLTPAGRMADAMAKKAEIEAKSAEQRQAVLDANPSLVTTMVKGQAEAAGLAGEFAKGGEAA